MLTNRGIELIIRGNLELTMKNFRSKTNWVEYADRLPKQNLLYQYYRALSKTENAPY